MTARQQISLEAFFQDQEQSRELCEAIIAAVAEIGLAELRITKSQVAFYRQKAFAWAWMPGKYLHGRTAPLVLTLSFRHQEASPRWKEIVEPSPGRFTHHLELYHITDVDDVVRGWLREAWTQAG
jgi:hypothetical protein